MSGGLKIVFAGTPEFAAVSLQALLDSRHTVCAVYTQPDRPAGRGRKIIPGPVKRLALESHLPLYQPASLKQDYIQENLRHLDADIMVVVAYGLLLTRGILGIPRLGCVNVHASLLPRWRGAAPIQRAIQAGDTQTGITIMEMDVGLDSGDILNQATCEIRADDTAASLHDRLAPLGAVTLISTLTQIENGSATRTPQNNSQACYAAKIDKTEAVIDWSQPAISLERLIRAFNPWPVAYTTFKDGIRLRIWQSEVVTTSYGFDSHTAAGILLDTGKQGMDVMTGDGVLRLQRVQPENGRPMSAHDFLNAYHLSKGNRLGQADLHRDTVS